MVYKIIISPRAQNEIVKAIDFYALCSVDAPNNFVVQLQKGYGILNINPFFRIQYKSVRALKLKKFPYSLFILFTKIKNLFVFFPVFITKEILKKDHDVNAI